jgi:hypothetical protein
MTQKISAFRETTLQAHRKSSCTREIFYQIKKKTFCCVQNKFLKSETYAPRLKTCPIK